MTAPAWLDDVVASFGRQMGLADFRLAASGAAAVNFENGVRLAFEYADGALVVSAGVLCGDDDATLAKLFSAVHWAARGPSGVRAAYLAKAGRGLYLARLPEREVTLTRLEETFRALWERIEAFRRAVA